MGPSFPPGESPTSFQATHQCPHHYYWALVTLLMALRTMANSSMCTVVIIHVIIQNKVAFPLSEPVQFSTAFSCVTEVCNKGNKHHMRGPTLKYYYPGLWRKLCPNPTLEDEILDFFKKNLYFFSLCSLKTSAIPGGEFLCVLYSPLAPPPMKSLQKQIIHRADFMTFLGGEICHLPLTHQNFLQISKTYHVFPLSAFFVVPP